MIMSSSVPSRISGPGVPIKFSAHTLTTVPDVVVRDIRVVASPTLLWLQKLLFVLHFLSSF